MKLGNQVRAIIEANHEHKESQYSSHGKQRIKAANIISLVHYHVGRYKYFLSLAHPSKRNALAFDSRTNHFVAKHARGQQ